MDPGRDYGQDQELVKQFFRDWTYVDEKGETQSKYGPELTQIANREAVHLHVEMADLEQFNQDLAGAVAGDTVRYTKIFYAALDEILPSYKSKEPELKDPMDVFIDQRTLISERNQRGQQQQSATSNPSSQPLDPLHPTRDIDGKYPPDLIRRAELSFKPASFQATPIRSILSEHIGKLVTIRGIVTRATDVKPKITIVCYTCDQCGCETFQPVDGENFTPLFECSSAQCKSNKALGRITMQTRGSKFVKFQEIKLQEHSDQVPTGHIPRAVSIKVHGELTRCAAPGDHISVTGVFLPSRRGNFLMRNTGLAVDTFIEAHYISKMNKTEDDELSIEPMTNEEASIFIDGESNFLEKLGSSIAPEIFGHAQLKKALLILLVGGVDKNAFGMKIRGNINICLMGDPGVAKSQLLSFIDRLASRSQYTTGRGSSGVGLTAAVLKDPITNELVLEGGALVLADQGICCIDEFDKMMDADRTAIHEVMEQQTVSIAKAGIFTTLNARVSILAAANPAYGRYNVHRTITDNLQLPPALLSRFDLLWLIKDKPDEKTDLELAAHVSLIHSNPDEYAPSDYAAIDMKLLRRYIELCKIKQPIIPQELDKKIVKIYLEIREKKRSNSAQALFTSPRSLLAIIRLSTAFARLRLSEIVEEADISAAVDLYNDSMKSLEDDKSNEISTPLKVLNLLKELANQVSSSTLRFSDIILRAHKDGIAEAEVMRALEELQTRESIEFKNDIIYMLGDIKTYCS